MEELRRVAINEPKTYPKDHVHCSIGIKIWPIYACVFLSHPLNCHKTSHVFRRLRTLWYQLVFTIIPSSNLHCDFVFDNGVTQPISEPTHLKRNSLILSNIYMCTRCHCKYCDCLKDQFINTDYSLIAFFVKNYQASCKLLKIKTTLYIPCITQNRYCIYIWNWQLP